jgi:hypothetical protein
MFLLARPQDTDLYSAVDGGSKSQANDDQDLLGEDDAGVGGGGSNEASTSAAGAQAGAKRPRDDGHQEEDRVSRWH